MPSVCKFDPKRKGSYSSSLLLSPSRPRQLRRRVGLPTGSESSDSDFFSVDEVFLSAGGFGAERPLVDPFLDELLVPPTLRRVGVRRILVSALDCVAVSSSLVLDSRASLAAAVLRVAVFRVVAARRVVVAVFELDEEDLRVIERRDVAALVAALSSPFGEAASSETSGRTAEAALDRA